MCEGGGVYKKTEGVFLFFVDRGGWRVLRAERRAGQSVYVWKSGWRRAGRSRWVCGVCGWWSGRENRMRFSFFCGQRWMEGVEGMGEMIY